ncbi:MAG: hypothetical protein M3313_14185 [Actinomycetota bacterium]|nr:hypothetical protein [Actinomycetota bacterium]
MGSGVLLAILVALWFVVLVPMVVTRGDLAATPTEPMRVLRRRSDRSAMSSSAVSSSAVSSSAISSSGVPSGAPASSSRATRRADARRADAENMHTEPIPALPRRVPGATLAADPPPVERRSNKASKPAKPVPTAAEPPVSASAVRDLINRRELDIRARRRRMLVGLIALAILWAGFAAFWQPVLWWPQILLDLIVFSYLVFLRLEAQREQDRQDRRRARAAARVILPEDRTERAVRRHVQYQQQVTAATGHLAIGLDDDDPGFAEMPTYVPTPPTTRVVTESPVWHERKAV